jgi:hypothetical protein
LGDQTADRDPRVLVEQWQHRLPDRSAEILEMNVDAIRTGGCQLDREISRAVIDMLDCQLPFA